MERPPVCLSVAQCYIHTSCWLRSHTNVLSCHVSFVGRKKIESESEWANVSLWLIISWCRYIYLFCYRGISGYRAGFVWEVTPLEYKAQIDECGYLTFLSLFLLFLIQFQLSDLITTLTDVIQPLTSETDCFFFVLNVRSEERRVGKECA